MIQQGFPRTHNLNAPEVREYWVVRYHLSTDNGLVSLDMKDCHPQNSTEKSSVLPTFCTSRSSWSESMCQWIGVLAWDGWFNPQYLGKLHGMFKHRPSQRRKPIILTQSTDWPFQPIVMDLFYVGAHAYLASSNWLTG